MPSRPILSFPDPRLRVAATPVTRFDADLRELAADLLDTMRAAPGIGITAPHIGVSLRLVVLELAAATIAEGEVRRRRPFIRIAGIVGRTRQAVREAGIAADLGYHLGLLSLGALRRASDSMLLAHAKAVAEVMPLMGFYLQPAVGGRILGYDFWRRFVEIENVLARLRRQPVDQALGEIGDEATVLRVVARVPALPGDVGHDQGGHEANSHGACCARRAS